MHTLVPSLWFNRNALAAAEFYAQIIPDTKIVEVTHYPTEGLPEFQAEFAGEPLTVEIDIDELRVVLTNADDTFSPNPSISIMLNFDPSRMENAEEKLRALWEKLSATGIERMPLGQYDFSSLYGWCEDRYGVNWQLILTDPAGEPRPFAIPAMLFTREARGKAAQAREKYVKLFSRLGQSVAGNRVDYPDNDGVILFSDAQLAGVWVVINDSTFDHQFGFNEGVSFQVFCRDQADIDAVWEELAFEEQPCGWCKDEYGVSWQVLPANLADLMQKPGSHERLLGMTKIEIARL